MRFDAGYLQSRLRSILFHLLVVAVTLIGWPFLPRRRQLPSLWLWIW